MLKYTQMILHGKTRFNKINKYLLEYKINYIKLIKFLIKSCKKYNLKVIEQTYLQQINGRHKDIAPTKVDQKYQIHS